MSSTDSDTRATVGTTWREDSHKDLEELEREIDETRADMQATLGALEQRLSAERLLDLTIGRVREHGGAFVGNLGSAARDNPVPLVLTSIGIAWLMMSGRNGNGARTSAPGVGERGHDARGRLDSSRDAAAHATESVRETASRATSAAHDHLARARSSVDHLVHEQPLMLGALGLAAGALIGAALPASEAESRMFGEASDRALDKAKAAGRESYRRARDRAREFTDRAKERLSEGNGGARSSTVGSPEGTEERTGDAAERGRDYDRPEDYNRAVERSAGFSGEKSPNETSPV